MNVKNCQKLNEQIKKIKDLRSKIGVRVIEMKNSPRDLQATRDLRDDELMKTRELATETLAVFGFVVKGLDENGQEIRFDLQRELDNSQSFYKSHDFSIFEQELPENIRLTRKIRKSVREAIKAGMNRVLVAPNLETQEIVDMLDYWREFADRQIPGVPASDWQQYGASPYFGKPEIAIPPQDRAKRQGAYLLFYSNKPVSQDSMNLTYAQAEQWLKNYGGEAMTLQELLMIQRKDCLETGKHDLLLVQPNGSENSNGTWCLATRNAETDECYCASWNFLRRQVLSSYMKEDQAFPGVGVRPVKIVSLVSEK